MVICTFSNAYGEKCEARTMSHKKGNTFYGCLKDILKRKKGERQMLCEGLRYKDI